MKNRLNKKTAQLETESPTEGNGKQNFTDENCLQSVDEAPIENFELEIDEFPHRDADAIAKENYDKYLRAVAELENYKRRAAKEKLEALKFGNERLLSDVLPVYDALTMAIEQVTLETDNKHGIKVGLEMLRDKFAGVLAKHGLEAIECLHKDFDPKFHEALLRRESDEFPHNTVVAELEKGFMLNGRLLRPARVEVCQNTNNTKNNTNNNANNK